MHTKFPSLTAVALLLFICKSFPQQAQYDLDYKDEVSKMVVLPVSPEAEAFAQHGNTNVNLYSGTPDVQLPLHEFRGREMNLPLDLVYDGTAIRVEQQATWVGLGWNLRVGGRISRMANGLPDEWIGDTSTYETLFNTTSRALWSDYIDSGYNMEFDSQSDALAYFQFLKDINENKSDVQPDYYSINVPGINDYIVFDYGVANPYPRALKNPRLKIEYTYSNATSSTKILESWKITGEDGTVFHFGSASTNVDLNFNNVYSDKKELVFQEIDNTLGQGGVTRRRYISSWLLTKIESPNKKDIYEFGYTSSGFWTQPFPAAVVGHVTHTLDGNSQNNTYGTGTGEHSNATTFHRIEQEFLTSIKHNSKTVISFVLKGRNDLKLGANSALDEIRFHKFNTSETAPSFYKRLKLAHGYFGSQYSSNPEINQRLKFTGLDINNGQQNTLKQYKFDYHNPSSLPAKNSTKQDYLGHYNGKNNSVLYPKYVSGDTYDGADLSPDENYAKTGMLTKITYPTRGYTTFDYELNSSKTVSSIYQTGGSYSEEVTYGWSSLTGGIVSNNPYCHSACDDEYTGTGDPAYKLDTFQVPATGAYTLQYQKFGYSNAEALLVKGFYSYEINGNIPPANFVWATSGSSSNGAIVNLDADTTYTILLVNDQSESSSTLRVFREETIYPGSSSTTSQNNPRSGLRIKSIKDYSEPGVLSSQRDYDYTEAYGGNVSSGGVIYDPQLIYFTTTTNPDSNGNLIQRQKLNRIAAGPGGSQPHIGYTTVFVTAKDVNNTVDLSPNGYEKHEFDIGVDGISTLGAPPFINKFTADFKAGKPFKSTIYDANSSTKQKTETAYNDFFRFSVRGMGLQTDADKQYKYVRIFLDGGKYRYELVDPIWSGYNFNATYTHPPSCSSPNSTCVLNDPQASTYMKQLTTAQGSFGAPISTKITRYFPSGSLEQLTDLTYWDNEQDKFVLKTQSSTNPQDGTLVSKFYYPQHGLVEGSTALTNKNRLSEVVKMEKSVDGAVVSSVEKSYVEQGNNVLPEIIRSSKWHNGSEDLSQRMVFQYDALGNVVESATVVSTGTNIVKGPPTAYIWGYNNMYIVAKLENVSHAQAAQYIGNIQTKSNSDDDNCHSTGSCNEQALRVALDALRDSFPGAMVTTYTYDPFIGMTSITDPKQSSMFYEYDDFNKLVNVKDMDGKILSHHEYGFKTAD